MGIIDICDNFLYGEESWMEKEDRLIKKDKFIFGSDKNVKKRINKDCELLLELIKEKNKEEKTQLDFALLEGNKWI